MNERLIRIYENNCIDIEKKIKVIVHFFNQNHNDLSVDKKEKINEKVIELLNDLDYFKYKIKNGDCLFTKQQYNEMTKL